MPLEQLESGSDAIRNLKSKLSNFETEKGRLSGLSYVPKSADEIIITTTPKAGTTWLQQICHQLRSGSNGGDMSFSEISEVVPWLELAYDQGQDLNDPQYGDADDMPRVFKSHAWEPHCPKGCKRIIVLRDPMDVVLSFYKFFNGWFFEPDTVSLEEFANEFWLSRGVPESKMNNASYFHHLVSWYKCRNDPDVLFIFFENLKENLDNEIRRIAKFMSTSKHDFTAEEIVQGAKHRSSYQFMKSHESHFDEKLSKLARNEACGLPKTAGMSESKIKRGDSGVGKESLPNSIREGILKKWSEIVEPETGCKSYEDLRTSMNTMTTQI